MNGWTKLAVLIISLIFVVDAGATSTGRTAPACGREAQALADLEAAFSRGARPGAPVFDDDTVLSQPPWDDGYWIKMRYLVTEEVPIPGSPHRLVFTIDIHYNLHLGTYQVDDVKFKSNPSSGCDGRFQVSDASAPGGGPGAETPPISAPPPWLPPPGPPAWLPPPLPDWEIVPGPLMPVGADCWGLPTGCPVPN
jgi:hypothetical protein